MNSQQRGLKYISPIDWHPSTDTIGEFAVRSWRAGWADADMDLQALHRSAPDLLEALKEAQAVLAVFWMGDHAGRPLADKIQAAIDKAERRATHEVR